MGQIKNRENEMLPSENSVLFITLDSCRYDTFESAQAVSLRSVGQLHCAEAPSFFTYGSHAAMFVGFTPGIASVSSRFINPRFGRLFRLQRAGWPGLVEPGFEVEGCNIVDGFRNQGYLTFGTGAVGWFDPAAPAAATLTKGFDSFFFAGNRGAAAQVDWLSQALNVELGKVASPDVFAFLNVGETHVPYHFHGAPWSDQDNPCVSFQGVDRRADCQERQRLCLEYLDSVLAPLIERFRHATILVCADHGDCWGEDGLWGHGFAHAMTLTVPLLIRYKGQGY